MMEAFSTPQNRNKSFILFAVCGVTAVAAAIVGIDDNPPGILLAYLSATAFVLAFVHPWRTVRQFLFLLAASALGLVLFAILNNLVAAVAHSPETAGTFQLLLQGLAVAVFFLATLICPAGLIVGVTGSVVMFIRNRHEKTAQG
jgi:hypothetical protein